MLLGTDVEAVILAMGDLVLGLAIIGSLPGPDRESSCTASIRLRPSPDKSGCCGDGEKRLGHCRELFIIAHEAPVPTCAGSPQSRSARRYVSHSASSERQGRTSLPLRGS